MNKKIGKKVSIINIDTFLSYNNNIGEFIKRNLLAFIAKNREDYYYV